VSRRARGSVALVLVLALALAGCAAHQRLEPSATTAAANATPAGSEILARRCGGCHARPDPAKMSAEQWQAALERMKRKITLPGAEWDTLAAMR
jgi:hypothetical protein